MRPAALTALRTLAKQYGKAPRILFVDPSPEQGATLEADGAQVTHLTVTLGGKPYEASDLWFGSTPASYQIVVLVRRSSARQLYQDLFLAARLVVPGGVLAMVCPTDAVADHCYQEASEVFMSTHPNFERTLLEKSHVVTMRREA